MKKFFIKATIFITLLVSLQLITVKIYKNFYWTDVPVEVINFKNDVQLGKNIFFFGDSVSFFAQDELDKRTVPDFISANMNGKRVASVVHSAYHSDIFQNYVSKLPTGESCPTVIIEINLRSFSEAWEKRPEYQYEKEKLFLDNYNNRWFRAFWKPLAIFKFFKLETFSSEEFRSTPIIRNGKRVGTMQDFYDFEKNNQLDELIKIAFNYDYLYDLSPRNKKVEALTNISRMRKSCSNKTLMYITPVDYQSGEKYWGQLFTKKIKQNILVIQGELKKIGANLVDWSTIYPSEAFMWKKTHFPDEHLHANWKADIGERIVSELR